MKNEDVTSVHALGWMRVLRRALGGVIVGALISTALVVSPVFEVRSAAAVDSRLFDPGQIVSDAVFFDGGAMSAADVQAFLNSQLPRCTSTYACLTNFQQSTPNMQAQAGRCGAYVGQPVESAAEIIARVGQVCGISQKALLVLVQKEMSLVTLANPSQSRFDHATGFGCPDTAACDPAVAGFFYQIYFAARQFKVYATSPTSFNYRAGQTNSILYHPNRACGSGSVYIANLATAGLYNYTPYQPNTAALSNFYGTGDECSSYGNRNFFRIFSDWFGSPVVGSSLIQATGSADIWLVSGSVKYRVPTPDMLFTLSVLGGVVRVSPSLPPLYSTGRDASNIIRAPGGAIYFHDARIRLPMSSCDLVVDYGGSCQPDGYTQLSDYQINQFLAGPPIGFLYATGSGGRYLIDNGTKREILDDRSQADAAIPTGPYVQLTESGISSLAVGAPIVRDSVFVRDRMSGQYYFFGAEQLQSIEVGTESAVGATARVAGAISSASLGKLRGSPDPFTGVVKAGAVVMVLTSSTKVAWGEGLPAISPPSSTISLELAASYQSQTLSAGSFVKHAFTPTVSVLTPTGLRPLSDWSTFRTLSGGTTPNWVTVNDAAANKITRGQVAIQPGLLVRSASDPRVYLVDGLGRLLYVDSFAVSAAAGLAAVQLVSDAVIGAYPDRGNTLDYAVLCGGTTWIAAGGSLHALSNVTQTAYGVTPVLLEQSTCSVLKKGADASPFIRTPDGAIYQLSAGIKRPIATMARYLTLDPTGSAFLNVDQRFASRFAVGPLA